MKSQMVCEILPCMQMKIQMVYEYLPCPCLGNFQTIPSNI